MHPRIAEYGATPARRRTLYVVAAHFLAFVGFIVWMYRVRAVTAEWPIPFEFGSLLMIFAMAMAGLCASITIAVGADRAAKGEIEESVRWIAIAISAWLVFLFLDIVEWVRMVYLLELGPKTPFGGPYLLMTGSHWVAVVACTVWFTYAVVDVRRRDLLAPALYSHFLAIWWIVLMFIVYFPNMHPLTNL